MAGTKRMRLVLWFLGILSVTMAPAAPVHAAAPLRITHGIASGDPTATEIVLWARASGPAQMIVEYWTASAPDRLLRPKKEPPPVDERSDFTGKVVLEDLTPGTDYLYWIRFRDTGTGAEVVSETGQFRTLPDKDEERPLTLVWWGDLGGQQYCRDPVKGYVLFSRMAAVGADLAVANGDVTYADATCPTATPYPDHPRNALSDDQTVAVHQHVSATDRRWTTPADVLAAMRAKWKYNLEDEAYRRFRARTPHVYQWDDHDVMNDWSPAEARVGDLRGTEDARPMVMFSEPARQSLFEFAPIRATPDRLIYRSFRLGKLAELFAIDARSYRDENFLPDNPKTAFDGRLSKGERIRRPAQEKSMLGAAQRKWLLDGLKDAQARGVVWKVISTNDSVGVPSGSYQVFTPEGEMKPLYSVRDGWAAGMRFNDEPKGAQDNPSGYESELRTILRFIKTERITNVVWLATDVHHARLIEYRPDKELAGLVFHEFVTGPVSAISLPPAGAPLSKTFRPREWFARGGEPRKPPSPAGYSTFFNFGVLKIAANGTLTVEVRDLEGRIPKDKDRRPGMLKLTPRR
jgi:alkaline phosphatase D